MSLKKVKCPNCDGVGGFGIGGNRNNILKCCWCDGKGKLTEKDLKKYSKLFQTKGLGGHER